MANKVFGVKNITHLLYGLIVLLPMFAILGRVIYTQSNPNSIQSYSDSKITQAVQITSNNDSLLASNQIFYYNGSISKPNGTGWNVQWKFTFDNPSVNLSDYFNVEYNVNGIGYATDGNYSQYYRVYLYNEDSLTWMSYNGVIYYDDSNDLRLKSLNFSFTLLTYDQNFYLGSNIIKLIIQSEPLDNAFEYSLKTFTEDNNLGEVDMFSWFTDLFLDHSNAHNQIYIGFVNWYLNYTMLVSCGYLFFLVLIWFINFIRKILDKSMYQDYGGF